MTVYFPGWNIASDSRNQVGNLPWDRLGCVNHAFWKIMPAEGGYPIASADPWADTDPDNPLAHFPQYAECAKKYPETGILLSVGGWTCCGYFSEMALTQESRRSFIRSCLDTLDAWPFLTGLDIDWEYPGVARPGNDGDEGNPVLGDDRTNFTLLLKELREALDAQCPPNRRMLTICAGASLTTLAHQDYASLFPYVDRINLMTYDMAGPWDHLTGHHTPLFGKVSADAAVQHLLQAGVPAEKISIGSPLYGYGWKRNQPGSPVLGSPAEPLRVSSLPWHELALFERSAVPEGEPGWHAGYDKEAEAAYLWNDDPASHDYLHFFTYESSRSLEAKLQYIRENRLGGLIVWEAHGDSAEMNWPMLTRMQHGLWNTPQE